MADPVPFGDIEKKHLVRLGYGLALHKMAHIDAAIRKDHFCRGREFFRALLPTASPARYVANRNGRSFQQRLNGKFRHRSFSRSSEPEQECSTHLSEAALGEWHLLSSFGLTIVVALAAQSISHFSITVRGSLATARYSNRTQWQLECRRLSRRGKAPSTT